MKTLMPSVRITFHSILHEVSGKKKTHSRDRMPTHSTWRTTPWKLLTLVCFWFLQCNESKACTMQKSFSDYLSACFIFEILNWRSV